MANKSQYVPDSRNKLPGVARQEAITYLVDWLRDRRRMRAYLSLENLCVDAMDLVTPGDEWMRRAMPELLEQAHDIVNLDPPRDLDFG